MKTDPRNPLFPLIEKHELILASGSPRRRELLSMLELPFTVDTSHSVDESYPASLPPEEIPAYLSLVKAAALDLKPDDRRLVITADTVVILGDEVLGKPADDAEARDMLCRMAGRLQKVVTGVTIVTPARSATFSEMTMVEFAPLTDEEIRYYVDTFHPLDKAGAYGIQEWIGAAAIRRIDGSFYNVMGLPIHRLYTQLKKFL
ncbi:MAG: Maf family nucleotide pyrophosphatase [Duncaniella sp.]|nr:Maf family nucleotide pyrophosphatase [Duncaniella sp.]